MEQTPRKRGRPKFFLTKEMVEEWRLLKRLCKNSRRNLHGELLQEGDGGATLTESGRNDGSDENLRPSDAGETNYTVQIGESLLGRTELPLWMKTVEMVLHTRILEVPMVWEQIPQLRTLEQFNIGSEKKLIWEYLSYQERCHHTQHYKTYLQLLFGIIESTGIPLLVKDGNASTTITIQGKELKQLPGFQVNDFLRYYKDFGTPPGCIQAIKGSQCTFEVHLAPSADSHTKGDILVTKLIQYIKLTARAHRLRLQNV